VTVRIRINDQHAELEIVDDGQGFDPKAITDQGGMGLITMRERAERLGSTLTILSAPGEGTRVEVTL
jgi:signal transduction histidine kinase